MSTPNFAYINSEVVSWARQRAGLSVGELAAKLKVAEHIIGDWESSAGLPAFSIAEKLAEELHIPFGYLFLSKPPKNEIQIPDLRTVGSRQPSGLSIDFLDALKSCLLKQQWYSEYLQSEGKKPLSFPGSMTMADGLDAVADEITTTLGIHDGLRDEAISWEQFKGKLVEAAEKIGILVMQSGVGANNLRPLSVKEFRGFAIMDSFAPLVFINSKDAGAARIFTLIHELAHLWIGKSGISNPELRKRANEQPNVIERFCNKVAAEVLVPKRAILKRWNADRPIYENVQTLARYFRVSRYVALRQAYEQDLATKEEYLSFLDTYPSVWKAVDSDTTGGSFYNTFFARNSKRVVRAVVKALGREQITYLEASKLFGVKIGTVKTIAERFGQ